MCFESNKSFFRFINFIFCLINLSLIIACVVTIVKKNDIVTYFSIQVTHDQFIDVYLIYYALFMNIFGFVFHSLFFLAPVYILETQFLHHRVNNGRWVQQVFVVGAGLVSIMAINGVQHLETYIISMTLYCSVISLCYFQDQYINNTYTFTPQTSPHTFAIPFYITLILFIMVKSLEHVRSLFTGRLAILTTASLMYTSAFLIIQKIQIYTCHNTSEAQKEEHTEINLQEKLDNEDEHEEKQDFSAIDDQLDIILSKQRVDIKFDFFYYTYMCIFQIIVSWVVINLTRNDNTLHFTDQ